MSTETATHLQLLEAKIHDRNAEIRKFITHNNVVDEEGESVSGSGSGSGTDNFFLCLCEIVKSLVFGRLNASIFTTTLPCIFHVENARILCNQVTFSLEKHNSLSQS